VKANVFLGKFIDQTFFVVERLSTRPPPWKFIDGPLGRRVPLVKNYCVEKHLLPFPFFSMYCSFSKNFIVVFERGDKSISVFFKENVRYPI